MANAMKPSTISTSSQNTVLNPAKYTSRLAKMNASGLSTPAAGSRYGGYRPGSSRRSPPSASGAIAYMNTIAEVASPTRPPQLGKGRKTSMPTTKQMMMDTNGTPRLRILLMTGGK